MLLGHSEGLYMNCYLLSLILKTVCLLFKLEPPLMCSCFEHDLLSMFFPSFSLSFMITPVRDYMIVHIRLHSCKLLFFLNAFTSYYNLTLQKYLDVLPGFILKSSDNMLSYKISIIGRQSFLNKSCIKPLHFWTPYFFSFFCKECNRNSTMLCLLISERIIHGT